PGDSAAGAPAPPGAVERREAEPEGGLVPLGEEPPEEEGPWRGRLRLMAAASGAFEADGMARCLRLDARRGFLDLAAVLEPGGDRLLRAGLVLQGGSWRLGLGGLRGAWDPGLLLGARRRPPLGRLAAGAGGRGPDLRPSASREPVLEGLAATGPLGPLRLDAAVLRGKDASGAALALAWRDLRLDWTGGADAGVLAAGWRRQGGDASVEIQGGAALATAGGEGRRGFLWQFCAEPAGLSLGLAALAVAGTSPVPPLLSGWLSARPGRELHGFAAGQAGVLHWRLARRRRTGLGLPEGRSRLETGLEASRPLGAGRLRLATRRLETRIQREQEAAPGFPRRLVERDVDQELDLGWSCARGALRWRWRGGQSGAATLVGLQGRTAGPLPLTLSLLLFQVPDGEPALLACEGGAVARHLESLDGSGWRVALRAAQSRGPLLVRLGASLSCRRGAPVRSGFWVEAGADTH
ncbi:MAG: hypothetical protein JW819_06755, partial [Candidatus Krumholzibacteriota bacterium]|nr:hypothetical protein [Candidatus Krumholzibacteriota bacterium]